MNSLTSTYRLSNGYEIPVVGFGTWQTPDGDVAVSSVKEALAAGYRHIDTAQGYKNEDTWRAFEELYEAGKIKAIGVSNFLPHHLDTLAKTAKIMPMVNQVFLAPGELQPAVVEYAKKHEMILEAYSPLGTGKIFDVPEMKQIAEAHDKTIAQVALRWSLQHGFLPLPKSVTPSRIKENTELFDFELTEEEMKQIDQLDGVVGKAKDPDTTQF